MANCISCGRETDQGQFFCPECLEAMAPEEREKGREAPPPASEGQLLPGGEGKQPPGNGPKAPEQAIDVVKASLLTPPAEKRVMKPSPDLQAGKAGPGRAKKEKPPKEGPTAEERVKKTAGKVGRGGARAGKAVKETALKTGRWLKGLARQESVPLQKADLVAWWFGLGASLLLLTAVSLMDFLKFAWMPVKEDTFEAVFSYLKAYDLGLFGYMLIACAALILIFHVLSLVCARFGVKSPVNPSFLVAVFCVIALILVPMALASNGAIVRSSTAQAMEPTEDLGYAKKTILYGAYIAMLCLVLAFGAASSILAEEKIVPEWMGSLFAWGKYKAQRAAERAPGGRHDRKKGGPDA
jgi:hypothetical protein